MSVIDDQQYQQNEHSLLIANY